MSRPWRSIAAGVLIARASAGAAWTLRGKLDADADTDAARLALVSPATPVSNDEALTGFARRAAVAHVVYSPEVRWPVEVGADQERALVTWLTKRMGTPVHAPSLRGLGYELIGGRLLPGEKGPVAQFMYGAADGQRLTLYVTREVGGEDTAFRFARTVRSTSSLGVEGRFGYAISAGADREALMKVSQEVYRQLKAG